MNKEDLLKEILDLETRVEYIQSNILVGTYIHVNKYGTGSNMSETDNKIPAIKAEAVIKKHGNRPKLPIGKPVIPKRTPAKLHENDKHEQAEQKSIKPASCSDDSVEVVVAITWYDALILDCGWFCHSKRMRIPGTEDMKEYHDYLFHIKASAIGTLIGLPACAIVGLAVQMLT